jgi:hypothetical protein
LGERSAEVIPVQEESEVRGGPDAGLDGLGARLTGSGDPVFLATKMVFRLERPRLTVRFLIVVVALAALATEMGLVGWRAVTFHSRAEEHARHLKSGRSFLYDTEELRQWHERMRSKYEFAASNPWLVVEPDPPKPK